MTNSPVSNSPVTNSPVSKMSIVAVLFANTVSRLDPKSPFYHNTKEYIYVKVVKSALKLGSVSILEYEYGDKWDITSPFYKNTYRFFYVIRDSSKLDFEILDKLEPLEGKSRKFCRFGSNCNNSICPFKHSKKVDSIRLNLPSVPAVYKSVLCKNGKDCKYGKFCSFVHPSGD